MTRDITSTYLATSSARCITPLITEGSEEAATEIGCVSQDMFS